MELIALLDIDDVLADTVPAWLKLYNRKYKQKLRKEDILDWNIAKYTVPECGDKIYDLLKSKSLYKQIKPLPDALEGVNLLRNTGFTIVYATGGKPEYSAYKQEWLINNGFFQREDRYIQTASKHLIRSHLIIDDNYDNICKSQAFGLLFNCPWNQQYDFKNRMMGWNEIIKVIKDYKDSIV